MKNIPVVILAGGRGLRMGNHSVIKPLVEISGKPLISHVMEIYQQAGFNSFIFCLGFGEEKIREKFKNNQNIKMVSTGLNSQTGDRVLKVLPDIKTERFFLTYSDGISDVNPQEILDFHRKQNLYATVLGVKRRFQYGVMKLFKDNVVKDFVEKPEYPELINGGFMIIEKKALKQFEGKKNLILETDILPTLAQQQKVVCFEHKGFWHSVDTYKDIDELKKCWPE